MTPARSKDYARVNRAAVVSFFITAVVFVVAAVLWFVAGRAPIGALMVVLAAASAVLGVAVGRRSKIGQSET